jgi:transposase
MSFKIHLSPNLRQALAERLRQAYTMGQLRLIKRIHALLHLAAGQSIAAVAELLNLGEQTVRDYLAAFLGQGLASLVYRRAPGRSPKLTQTQRQQLADLITAGPEAAGYATGCWSAVLLQDLIQRRFRVEYHPHYLRTTCVSC